jgi:hypothetical protein
MSVTLKRFASGALLFPSRTWSFTVGSPSALGGFQPTAKHGCVIWCEFLIVLLELRL